MIFVAAGWVGGGLVFCKSLISCQLNLRSRQSIDHCTWCEPQFSLLCLCACHCLYLVENEWTSERARKTILMAQILELFLTFLFVRSYAGWCRRVHRCVTVTPTWSSFQYQQSAWRFPQLRKCRRYSRPCPTHLSFNAHSPNDAIFTRKGNFLLFFYFIIRIGNKDEMR